MTWQDIVNAVYEIGGTAATVVNIRTLLRDRIIRGMHWAATTFFFSWGVWNLYYYSHLDQFVSMLAASTLAVSNCVYLLLAWKIGAFKRHL